MHEDKLKILKIIIIITVILGLLGAFAYIIYGFSLFWATFAAGITIGLLLIIILALLIAAAYLWIRSFLLKREVKKYESRLEQVEMELTRCRSTLRELQSQDYEED
ncbi:MAG: hypothetical protein ACXVHR_06055 [Methanobacterium sp.]